MNNDSTTRDQGRHERLSAALRENLKRRKQQARGRSEAGQPSTGEADPDSDRAPPADAARDQVP